MMSANGTSAMSGSASAERDEQFLADIERWTRRALADGASDYNELLRGLPGVDPVLLAPVLHLLLDDPALQDLAARLTGESQAASGELPAVTELPVPHPLEYYWANDAASLELLAGKLTGAARPGDSIVYLGAPNVCRYAAAQLSDRRHVLLDRSRARTAALVESLSGQVTIICMDLLVDELPEVSAQAVVMDPPWYPEHLESFLWAGARLCRPAGTVFSSYPPAGTRPGMNAELSGFLAWARDAGLRLLRHEPGVLRYLSPAFERSAYAAAGLPGVASAWRSGDLLTFKAGAPSVPRPVAASLEEWCSYSIREIPIFVRQHRGRPTAVGAQTATSPLLHSIVEGDVLPSVSRREPLRAAVSLWSSRNRVLGSTELPAVHAICAALEHGLDPITALAALNGGALAHTQAENVRAASEHLLRLVNLEREEHMIA
jgi:hypothetical protein